MSSLHTTWVIWALELGIMGNVDQERLGYLSIDSIDSGEESILSMI